MKRFAVCIPLFVIGYGITLVNFDIVWRYFAWANQTLAAVVLWSIYVWLARRKRNYWVALIPAVAMTFVVTCFVFVSPQFIGIENRVIAFSLAAATTLMFGFMANLRVNPKVMISEESSAV